MKWQNRETFEGDLSEKINTMEEDLSRWEGNTEEDKDFDEKLTTLKQKRQQLETKLEEMRHADNESDWEQHREQADALWAEVKQTYDELLDTRESTNESKPTSELLKGSSSAAGMMGDDSV